MRPVCVKCKTDMKWKKEIPLIGHVRLPKSNDYPDGRDLILHVAIADLHECPDCGYEVMITHSKGLFINGCFGWAARLKGHRAKLDVQEIYYK